MEVRFPVFKMMIQEHYMRDNLCMCALTGCHCVVRKWEFYRAEENTNLYSSSEDTLATRGEASDSSSSSTQPVHVIY